MKRFLKIHKLYILSLIIVFSSSCTDLEEHPVGVVVPGGYFQKEADVQTVIDGCFGDMASSNYYGKVLPASLQLMGDMVDVGLNFGDYGDLGTFIQTPTNSYAYLIWRCSYGIVNGTNLALTGIQQIDETQDVKNRLEAEAKFARALVYYHLVRLYGEIPYIESGEIDISTVRKASVADVYTSIISDLEFAKEYLPMQHPDNVRSRPSKGSAATLLASVHLTRGNWQEAYDEAKWVIDNAGALDYALEPDFQDLFRAETQDNSKEYIFAVDFMGDIYGGDTDHNSFTLENDQGLGAFNGVEGGDKPYRGWSMLVPSLDVYATWDNEDYRRKVSLDDSLMLREDGVIHPYTDFPDVQRPHIAKWTRFSGVRKSSTAGWRSDMNYICFRYAEVLLIAAEAGNELGKTGEAVGYVNQVRARARSGGIIDFDGNGYGSYGPGNSPADVSAGISQSDFRTLVLEERRIELAFEFKRWYDIVRRDLGDEVFSATGLEGTHSGFNKNKYLLPIPQEELDIAPYLGPQNPGY